MVDHHLAAKAWISLLNTPMKPYDLALCIAILVLTQRGVGGAELRDLKVLYVGDAGPRRAAVFQSFLRPSVGKADVAVRAQVTPDEAKEYDVVLLDWHQSNRPRGTNVQSRLGAREAWTKPTVLLGSAGLYLAMAWELAGGFG